MMSDNLIGAHAMKKDFNRLWQNMVSIEAKHADNCTPWRPREIDFVVNEAIHLLGRLPNTKYNKDHKKKALELASLIANNPKDNDFFRMNHLRDEIHSIWNYASPNSSEVMRYEEVDKKHPSKSKDAWDNDNFDGIIDKKLMTADLCPSRGDRNIKKEADIGFVQREFFFAKLIELHCGKKIKDRFWTFLHDIYEDRLHVGMSLDLIRDAVIAFENNAITQTQFASYVRRANTNARRNTRIGPDTWDGDGDWHLLFQERCIFNDIMRGETPVRDCETTNCREVDPITPEQMEKLMKGAGIDLWWCPKHIEKKPSNTYYEDDD